MRFFASLLLMVSTLAHAQCNPGDILVGETATEYICKNKFEYAACVRRTGEALSEDKKKCVDKVFPFCDSVDKPDPGQTECIKGCIAHIAGGIDKLSDCASDCMSDSFFSGIQRRACDFKLRDCWADTLQNDKARKEECKK